MKKNIEDIIMPIETVGLTFKNPFIVASGPASRDVSQLVQAEKSGWGGVSIKLTIDPEPYISQNPRYRWLDDSGIHIFTLEKRLNLEQGLRLIESGREQTKDLILFANITYAGDKGLDGWAELAKKFENAGAHAIEINFCCPNMSFNLDAIGEYPPPTPSKGGEKKEGRPSTGASLGSNVEVVKMITRAIKESVSIPVFAKLTPEGGNIGEVAKGAVDAGADGVCSTGNRLGVPPIDIYNPEKIIYRLQENTSLGCISGPWLKPLALRDVLQMRRAIGPDHTIIGAGGVRNFADAVEMGMVGADLIGVCTAVMLMGFDILPRIMRDLRRYLQETGRNSFADIRDVALPYFKTAAELTMIPGYARTIDENCTGCGLCARIAHCHAIEIIDQKAVVRRDECLGCSTCVDICPRGAMEMHIRET
jgi:dihydroorotate dehydrogenase/NAD-dependent dihydropyrimidine dehydrogenase PreA subunit